MALENKIVTRHRYETTKQTLRIMLAQRTENLTVVALKDDADAITLKSAIALLEKYSPTRLNNNDVFANIEAQLELLTTKQRAIFDAAISGLMVSDAELRLIFSKKSLGDTVYKRSIIMYCLRRFGFMRLKEIGELFNRDHSSVMHSIDKVADYATMRGYIIQPQTLCKILQTVEDLGNSLV